MASTDTATDAGTLAKALFADLTAGGDFSLPPVDLDKPEFNIPDLITGDIQSLTEADLTSRKVGGSGMFDGIMDAFRAHLQAEFEKGRLTGAQYAEVYISNSATALSAAVQYLLSKDQAYWQSVQAQSQAQIAQIGVVNARVGLETTKVQLATARLQAKTLETEYALKKLQLAREDAAWELTKAQKDQVEYQTTNMLPAQLVGLTKDNEVKSAQILGMTKDNLVKDAQITGMGVDNEIKAVEKNRIVFETTQMMPAQLTGLTKDNEVKSAQIIGLTKDNEVKSAQILGINKDNQVKDAQVRKINFEVDEMMPAQMIGLEKDNEVKTAQITGLTKDNEVKTGEIAKITYEVANILPAQKAAMTAETDLFVAQKAKLAYETAQILPAQKQSIDGDVSMKIAQRDQVLFETASILPAQKKKIDTEEAVLKYQLQSLFPAQVAGHTADTAGKIYNNEFILPETLKNLREQLEGNRAKTMDTRTDGTTVKGTVGMQNKLYAQQIDSYKRDAETKLVKILADGWITQKSVDEGITIPSSMDNPAINAALTKLKTNLGL